MEEIIYILIHFYIKTNHVVSNMSYEQYHSAFFDPLIDSYRRVKV